MVKIVGNVFQKKHSVLNQSDTFATGAGTIFPLLQWSRRLCLNPSFMNTSICMYCISCICTEAPKLIEMSLFLFCYYVYINKLT